MFRKLGLFSRLGSFAGVIAFGCTAPAPGSDIDGQPEHDASTTDAAAADAPTADAAPDAPIDAGVDAGPDAFVCAADEFIRCDGDDAVFCNAAGDAEVAETCALGCNVSAGRCSDVDPSNDLGQYLDLAADGPALTIPEGSTIDTDSGVIKDSAGTEIPITSYFEPAPTAGVPIRVYPVESLTLNSVEITGDAAVAFVSDGDVDVQGILRVRAGLIRDSSDPCQGGGVETGTNGLSGSGGGGFGSAGGGGGDVPGASGGAGGSVSGNQQLVPLRGGCGGGGGAIQIVSRSRITIQAASFIDANGTGEDATGFSAGSGGGVLVEAPTITVANQGGIVANGAGGAGACDEGGGADGLRATTPAPGEQCSGTLADGGDGASLGNPAENGGDRLSSDFVLGGGGGGGVGRIRINVEAGGYQPTAGAVVSPAPSVGTIATR